MLVVVQVVRCHPVSGVLSHLCVCERFILHHSCAPPACSDLELTAVMLQSSGNEAINQVCSETDTCRKLSALKDLHSAQRRHQADHPFPSWSKQDVSFYILGVAAGRKFWAERNSLWDLFCFCLICYFAWKSLSFRLLDGGPAVGVGWDVCVLCGRGIGSDCKRKCGEEGLSRRVLTAPACSKSRVHDNTDKGNVRSQCHIKESLN